MSKVLYIATKSLYGGTAQKTLLDIAKNQKEKGNEVGILLIQDSTLVCWKGGQNIVAEATSHGIEVYAIEEDLKARGIIGDKVHPKVKQVNYDHAITIIMDKYEKVNTWC